MAAEIIRIGIIGAGSNTRKMHIPKLQVIEGVQIVEVANRTTASAQKVADEFQIPTVRNHWQEIIESKEVDAIVIGTWPDLHCEAACRALQAGKHVLCEARMAMDEVEARTMLQTSYKHPECVVQIVPSPFTLHVDPTLLKMLDSGEIGTPRFFRFEYQAPPSVPLGETLHWRRNKKYSGSNIMMLGIIYESLLRWFGSAEWVDAHAEVINNRAMDPETTQEVEVEVPDYLSVQMKMTNGILGSLFIHELSTRSTSSSIKIYGDKGFFHLDFELDGKLYLSKGQGNELNEVQIPPEQAGKWRVEEEFINTIRGLEEIEHTTFTTGVEYMKFTQAVNESFNGEGDRITIPPG
ncbi:MAG: Gfo/Idh/MocA family oxidoreductase [Nitrospinaceae bacterium]